MILFISLYFVEIVSSVFLSFYLSHLFIPYLGVLMVVRLCPWVLGIHLAWCFFAPCSFCQRIAQHWSKCGNFHPHKANNGRKTISITSTAWLLWMLPSNLAWDCWVDNILYSMYATCITWNGEVVCFATHLFFHKIQLGKVQECVDSLGVRKLDFGGVLYSSSNGP